MANNLKKSRLKILSTWCASIAMGLVLCSRLEAGYFIETVAGNGVFVVDGNGYAGDGGLAVSATLNNPTGVFVDSSNNIYFADLNNSCIRKVDQSGIISTIAGIGGSAGYSGDGGVATSAHLNAPYGVYGDSSGNIYFADRGNHCIRMISNVTDTVYGISCSAGYIYTIAGIGGSAGYSGDGSTATASQLNTPYGVYVDTSGILYISDSSNHCIRKVTQSGIISTIAGTGSAGYSGDGGSATSAQLKKPFGICIDSSNNIYIADNGNSRIRMFTVGGNISTVAGTGTVGCSGDGGSATSAQIDKPNGICIDSSNAIYIADNNNFCVRKFTVGGNITTVAGIGGSVGYSGDGGLATSAQMFITKGVCLDGSGNLYITDNGFRIRKLFIPQEFDFANGDTITTNVNGGVIFDGTSDSDVCTFSGSATDDVQVTKGKVVFDSSTSIADGRSVRIKGGDVIAAAARELPIFAMDQAGELYVNTSGTVGLKALTGSGELTIATTNSSNGSVHLEDLSANTGGIAACSQPVVIDSATKFPGDTCAIQGVATVSAAPGQASTHNLTFGEIDATSANTAAASLTNATLYVTKVNIGAKTWSHDVTAH